MLGLSLAAVSPWDRYDNETPAVPAFGANARVKRRAARCSDKSGRRPERFPRGVTCHATAPRQSAPTSCDSPRRTFTRVGSACRPVVRICQLERVRQSNCQIPPSRRVRGVDGRVECCPRTPAGRPKGAVRQSFSASRPAQDTAPPSARRSPTPHPSPNPNINCSGTRTFACSTGGARGPRPCSASKRVLSARVLAKLGPAHRTRAARAGLDVGGEDMREQPRPAVARRRRVVPLAEQLELIAARAGGACSRSRRAWASGRRAGAAKSGSTRRRSSGANGIVAAAPRRPDAG